MQVEVSVIQSDLFINSADPMRGKVNTPVVGLVWHDVSDSLKVAKAGHKAVLTPATHMYFDFPESATPGGDESCDVDAAYIIGKDLQYAGQ